MRRRPECFVHLAGGTARRRHRVTSCGAHASASSSMRQAPQAPVLQHSHVARALAHDLARPVRRRGRRSPGARWPHPDRGGSVASSAMARSVPNDSNASTSAAARRSVVLGSTSAASCSRRRPCRRYESIDTARAIEKNQARKSRSSPRNRRQLRLARSHTSDARSSTSRRGVAGAQEPQERGMVGAPERLAALFLAVLHPSERFSKLPIAHAPPCSRVVGNSTE